MTQQDRHVVLLGDSIFDNGSYTSGGPDVVAQVRGELPAGWRATLLAEDGATTMELGRQLRQVPPAASHLVVSVGGNDALRNIDVLSMRVTSSAQTLIVLGRRAAAFENAYMRAIGEVVSLQRAVLLCTIYNGALDDEFAEPARAALTVFNDVILRAAAALRVDVLDLRSLCTERADYANPIEPSPQGGAKIARGIAIAVGAVAPHAPPPRIWSAACH
jgi:hypothetical protein